MGIQEKWFDDKQASAAKLWSDVGSNNVRVYDVSDYQQKVNSIEVHPPGVLQKFSHVEVAVSGDISSGRGWIVIAPYRVDANRKNEKFYDIDPVLLVLDTNTGIPHQSGVAAYHQTFPNRTTPISGFISATLSEAVRNLRQVLTTGLQPLESGSPQVLNALQSMYSTYSSSF